MNIRHRLTNYALSGSKRYWVVFAAATALIAAPGHAEDNANGTATTARVPDLTGAVIPPFPELFESYAGTCLAQGGELCAYTLASLNRLDGTIVAVLGQKLERRIDGHPFWRVLDTHPVPTTAENETWAWEECSFRGVLDPSVVGIVRETAVGEAKQTTWAIRFDLSNRALTEIPPDDVTCVLPGS